jgi:serine phosphatase RsbU (regulator of sigma subunit)
VAGDYVDAVAMKDGRTLLTIADVCGKGMSAALIASSIHTMVHACVLGGQSPVEMMNHLNEYLRETLPPESFVTMVAAAIDPGRGEVELVDAGHPPSFLLSDGAPPTMLKVEGNLPLGVEVEALTSQKWRMSGDQVLVLYSDGLSELSIGDAMLGIAGLSAEIGKICARADRGAQEMGEQLRLRLIELQGDKAAVDDSTFLIARLQGEG